MMIVMMFVMVITIMTIMTMMMFVMVIVMMFMMAITTSRNYVPERSSGESRKLSLFVENLRFSCDVCDDDDDVDDDVDDGDHDFLGDDDITSKKLSTLR